MIYRVLHIIFFLFFSFLCVNLFAQKKPFVKNKILQQQPIWFNDVEFDSTSVREIHLSNLKIKYIELNYEETENKEENLLVYFFKTLFSDLFKSFYNFKNDLDRNDYIRGLYILFFLTISFIAFRLILKHKGRWFFDKSDKNLYNENEENIENIKTENFIELIKKYENEVNFQQSIRLYYLWLLKILSEENHIKWHIEKTNSDYIREIKNKELKSDFQQLSYLYNYVWYGKFSVNIQQYNQIKKKFEKYTNPKK